MTIASLTGFIHAVSARLLLDPVRVCRENVREGGGHQSVLGRVAVVMQVDWSETWILTLLGTHLLVLVVAFATRTNSAVQMVLLVAIRTPRAVNNAAVVRWALYYCAHARRNGSACALKP